MTTFKTIAAIALLAFTAFGQEKHFKEFLDLSAKRGRMELAEMEEVLPAHARAFSELSAALANPTAAKVRESFEEAVHLEWKLDTLVTIGLSAPDYILDNARTALKYNEITPAELEEAKQLAEKIRALAKKAEIQVDQKVLHLKMIEYSFKESGRSINEMKKAAELRKKAAEALAKQLEGEDKTKIEVYADRLLASQKTASEAGANTNHIWWLLYYADYEFKQNLIREKQYDKAKKLSAELKLVGDMKWALKEQLDVYRKAKGPNGVVEMVMSVK